MHIFSSKNSNNKTMMIFIVAVITKINILIRKGWLMSFRIMAGSKFFYIFVGKSRVVIYLKEMGETILCSRMKELPAQILYLLSET